MGADVVGIGSNKVDGASGSTTIIALNGGSTIRAGKQVTDKIMVEPNVGFFSASSDNFSSSATELGVAALWIFRAMEASKPGVYVRPFIGMTMNKVESGGSTVVDESRVNMGVGAGVKKKSMGVIWRAEVFFKTTPKKDTSPAETDMGLKLGGGFTP